MAEVDFGDSELFEQLDGDVAPKPIHIRFDEAEDSELESGGLQEQLARCEETIEQLRAENILFRHTLGFIPRGKSLHFFINLPLQFHQEIEDFISGLLQKYEEQKRANPEKRTFNTNPQPSSFMLEENGSSNVDTIKKNKEAFSPRDLVQIGMKRKQFMDSCAESGNQNYQQRYHAEEIEERFARFKPGVISSELQDALGITDRHLPPFIYRMRQLGYPPGWLKDAELENSGLSLYDGKDTSDGEIEEDPVAQNKYISYDVSKLINYPGFNTPPPSGVLDDWRSFGSIPMQQTHQKDVFSQYLSHNFPSPSQNTSQKRSTTQSDSGRKRQKSSRGTKESPMDIEEEADNNVLNEKDSDVRMAENDVKPNGTDAGLNEIQEDDDCAEEAACVPSPFQSGIPDISKFAEGITPFEYDNMSEATGTYLRLRNVLKNSPRNQQRSKK
uniref:PSP proline-rich domain-containing protein n=1 Tax=Pyxicephalus adspersus TaxID=30357 RepID=A0AAV3AGG9_PYXAD|nr:TPA: hypothetical protein GDO54_014130 [Pyxicephalus adspersus]